MWDSVDFDKVINILTNSTEDFRKNRSNFIQKRIETIRKQCDRNDMDFNDSMIREVTMSKSQKICLQCGCESHTLIEFVEVSLVTFSVEKNLLHQHFHQVPATDINPYKSFNFAETLTLETKCTTGEPDFLNPRNYQNIVNIIQNIDSRAGIKQHGGTKEWNFVECDGLPYKVIRDIIANVCRCQICQPSFQG